MMDHAHFDPLRFGFESDEGRQLRLEGAERTEQLGAELAERLQPGDFLGLIGNLGSGKTTLVRGLVGDLDARERVSSPTYTLINVYRTDPPVAHVDLYRLESEDDLASTGYWDYTGNADGIVCVEWLDRVPEAWPGTGLVVELEYADEARNVTLWGRGRFESMIDAIVDTMEETP